MLGPRTDTDDDDHAWVEPFGQTQPKRGMVTSATAVCRVGLGIEIGADETPAVPNYSSGQPYFNYISGPTNARYAQNLGVSDKQRACIEWLCGQAVVGLLTECPSGASSSLLTLYQGFALGLRDVEEVMPARGLVVSYETIGSCCARFGPDYAALIASAAARPAL